MSVSSISSSSIFTASTTQRPPQRPNDDISKGVDGLLKAAQSGDKDTIQSAYDSLSKAVSAKDSSSSTSTSSSSTTSSSDSNNPVSKLLSTVSDALKSGDVSNLASTLQAQAPAGPGGPGGGGGPGGAGGPPPGGPPPGGGQQGGASDEVKSALGGLAESLGSGSLSSAQSAYSTLANMLSQSANSSSSTSSSSSSSSTSSTSSTSSSSSTQDKFTSTLSDIGTALSSGNMSQAQQLFSSLLPRGSNVNVFA